MYIIRDVFKTKPGKAKDLVTIFKDASAHMKDLGVKNSRVLTDSVSTYWTVVWESEVDDLKAYVSHVEGSQTNEKLKETMKGYKDLVVEGYREILKEE